MLRKHLDRASVIVLPLLVLSICCVEGGYGQTFSSGSTGADGALNYLTPGTYNFDPNSFNPPLNPAGDNVFNFTTINIAAGVTVKLSSKTLSGPVYWLAQGPVTINGTLNLNGEPGYAATTQVSSRIPASGGAGGYGGGVGGSVTGLPPPQPGNGPGGGAAPTVCCPQGGNGTFTGNQYLIPLIGGSGGAGGITSGPPNFGGGGGGGGGAILIASPVSITVGGNILANGGPGGSGSQAGGNGSGGSIRIVAPAVSIIGPGDGQYGCFQNYGLIQATGGVVRVESLTFAGRTDCAPYPMVTSAPLKLVVPATRPSTLQVASLVSGGTTIPINANPFSFPDALINTSSPVTVNVQAQYIPTGTVPKIIVMSETGPDQSVNCSALAGTLQQSTCSAQITFPTGGSRGFVKATW
jgi:hypothetical protein